MNNLGKIALSAATILSVPIATSAQETKIRPDTALARLVAEVSSQREVTLAAAPVPRGKLDIPQWLLAQYRRNHSEMPKVAAQLDPTGGYPMALETLYAWMLRHQDLQASPAPEFKAAVAPSVGRNLKISGTAD